MSRPISRLSSRTVTIANSAEVFEVIREQTSTSPSSIDINATATGASTATSTTTGVATNASTVAGTDTKPEEENEGDKENPTPTIICPCKATKDAEQEKKNAEEIQRLLREKEMELEDKFQERLAHEMQFLKERSEFILRNEQTRVAYMLREAHRERQEKISALQTQLECKNMAGLMYVLCAERRKSKMEILRLKEEYTSYIQALQEILTESQTLILNLSRGYKTAARVDHEWREKMKKIIKHFQNFVNNFTGGLPESNQYLFHLPHLLKIKAPVKDNPCEDPCEEPCEEEEEESEENEIEDVANTWWNTLEGDERPFVMFGDMADFKPPERRQVLKAVKAQKTAPRKWKEYVFHDMFLKADCPNNDVIKDEFIKRVPPPSPVDKWEQTDKRTSTRGPEFGRRVTTQSVDIRGNMGSILKIITSQVTPPTPKSILLAARDSLEIASTTRLREKLKHSSEHSKSVFNIGKKIDSLLKEKNEGLEEEQKEEEEPEIRPRKTTSKDEDDMRNESQSALGSIHNDSLHVINQHVPDQDHKLPYEKICPMEKCQKMQMDDFMQSLPSYMRANPFTHFEQTYEDYETCTPEQLEILRQRLEEKKKKERVVIDVTDDNPLLSWTPSVEGIGIQTSYDDMYLPPCTCDVRRSNTSVMNQMVYNIADLIPVKKELERINAECFFDDNIEFNRFKVIGRDDRDNEATNNDKENFNKNRLQEIKRILKQHPSLCEIFQANIRC